MTLAKNSFSERACFSKCCLSQAVVRKKNGARVGGTGGTTSDDRGCAPAWSGLPKIQDRSSVDLASRWGGSTGVVDRVSPLKSRTDRWKDHCQDALKIEVAVGAGLELQTGEPVFKNPEDVTMSLLARGLLPGC